MVRLMEGPVKHVGKSPHPRRTDARAIAAEVLVRVLGSPDARASELLAAGLAMLSRPGANRDDSAPHGGDQRAQKDRALATELVYGVLRWRRRLEHVLSPLLPRGMDGVEPLARALLLIGAYQIRMLDRIPPEVAVSATQDTARTLGASRLTGLLNAVLRKVVSGAEVLPSGTSPAAIGVRTSLPDWVIAELKVRYGDEAENEAMALRERARVTLRPTLARGGLAAAAAALKAEGFTTTELESPLVRLGIAGANDGSRSRMLLVESGDVFASRAFAEGHFWAQDPASLAVVDLVEVSLEGGLQGARVLDLCAGRGVKATALMDRGARLTAVDVGAGKLDELVRTARRLGVHEQLERTVVLDAAASTSAEALSALGLFDAVLVDAPCTGLGTLRRHPELVWRRRPEDVPNLAELQARLLMAGASQVAPGGLLVYAVCSFVGREANAALPSGFREISRVDVPPSSGLDAFQVIVFERSTP
jgi:16S rRNA (cytosine967-C5)-methyltransferase